MQLQASAPSSSRHRNRKARVTKQLFIIRVIFGSLEELAVREGCNKIESKTHFPNSVLLGAAFYPLRWHQATPPSLAPPPPVVSGACEVRASQTFTGSSKLRHSAGQQYESQFYVFPTNSLSADLRPVPPDVGGQGSGV